LNDIALYFYDAGQPASGGGRQENQRLRQQVEAWNAASKRPLPPVLSATKGQGALNFFDTRACAVDRRVTLSGPASDIYLACDAGTSHGALQKRFCAGDIPSLTPAGLNGILDDLKARKFILELGGQLVGLACFGNLPTLPLSDSHPHGGIRRFDLRRSNHFIESLERLKYDPPTFPIPVHLT
jgi:hypothetical protein